MAALKFIASHVVLVYNDAWIWNPKKQAEELCEEGQ